MRRGGHSVQAAHSAPEGLGLDGGRRNTLSHAVQGGSIPCTVC
ncbi:hypothetical protein S2091_4695 [Solimicrobium silvestre]|uniref:Uncharacterized protein n=1 Tax=Solimicrobium silvestre TaxID=2099400 RepID=A0A2S9GSC1_9BURK|nr:hypothetical protein S2091_4695 [Solimicrobium silvestre]